MSFTALQWESRTNQRLKFDREIIKSKFSLWRRKKEKSWLEIFDKTTASVEDFFSSHRRGKLSVEKRGNFDVAGARYSLFSHEFSAWFRKISPPQRRSHGKILSLWRHRCLAFGLVWFFTISKSLHHIFRSKLALSVLKCAEKLTFPSDLVKSRFSIV